LKILFYSWLFAFVGLLDVRVLGLEIGKVFSIPNQLLFLSSTENQKGLIYLALLVPMLASIALVYLLWKERLRRIDFQKKHEESLKQKEVELNEVIASYEKDRAHIAKDLRDRFGRLISVLEINLSQLKETSSTDREKPLEVHKNAGSVLHEMNAELDRMSFDLLPQSLIKRGLVSALRELASRLTTEEKVNCEVQVRGNNVRLSALVELSLFRITQEWIKDILQNSAAKQIVIQLNHEDDGVFELQIEDDGGQFDPSEGKRIRWANILVRLNQINGSLGISPGKENKGTLLKVTLETSPLKRPNSEHKD
jgi:signal transduction histidine kinase